MPTAASTAAPTATPPEFTLIRGYSRCTVPSREVRNEDGKTIFVEHFSCTYDTNDARLNGTLELDVTTTFEPDTAPAAYAEWSGILSTDEGTWSGVGRGAVVVWPDHGVVNYGDTTFIGAGAYEGLRYRELMTGGNAIANIAGWIKEQ